HESFEDEEVASVLNRHFVSIKVDREERPDVDQVYMSVCQALTGHGGWPLSIFMTAEGEPFFAGTYFPKTGRMGLIGFIELLERVAGLWRTNREKILTGSGEIRKALRNGARPGFQEPPLDTGVLKKGYAQLERTHDERWGGFGSAPKFPTPHHLTFLLRWYRRTGDPQAGKMAERTLQAMRQGGIFDQLGFGFHRYSVDEKWLIPHFEKMLYDQALLAMAYTEAHLALGKEDFGKVSREVFTYILRDMTSPQGGFYSAEDADSEGHEGRFYVWKPAEVLNHLGREEGDLFCRFYGVTPEGNFEEGSSVLHIPRPLEPFAAGEKMNPQELEKILERCRETLFQRREKRTHPLKDDKVLTSWNGLMIAALALGSQALQDPLFSHAACRAADFILEHMRNPQGRLYRRWREGEVAIPGFLEDYAFLVWGLIELYEATFRVGYLEEAIRLNQVMIELFEDQEKGGFFFSGKDNEALITRSKELYDGATPSGNSVAALNILRLARLTGSAALENNAARILRAFSAPVAEAPMAFTQFLNFLDFYFGPSQEIVLVGDPAWETSRALTAAIRQKFHPNKVFLFRPEDETGKKLAELCPFVKEMKSIDRRATAYICQGYSCQSPLTDLAAVQGALK
ncbi:MAG: thioredoxin domain-containing protein, partial [Syntrophaceae bacterium]|nr:thioredoxin domain-containing protein [Syntrophaceae bacterium]